MEARHATVEGEKVDRIVSRLGKRSIVLVGMMGAGKTSIGRRLANILHLPFLDADAETRDRIALMLQRGWEVCRVPRER